jgi:hypothetical protein
MEGIGKPHTNKYKEITNDELWRVLYAYTSSGLGLSSAWFLLDRVYIGFEYCMITFHSVLNQRSYVDIRCYRE